ncbi:helix-turn-helix transcriptional regulator [Lachnospiraceae bacterium OttesenSCG-928-D06]|nr:helix-turn-helix transcriptional regulator [Lachnospiraceae bacterium OttesenSCG-928-D06]
MTRYEAERAAKQMILSGYQHHSYEDEKRRFTMYFNGSRRAADELLHFPLSYLDILAPGRGRSVKNALVCLITVLCRAAIEHGVDSELSFALSDYYINALEKEKDEGRLTENMVFIMEHYYDLVQQERTRCYTKLVAKAVKYIIRCVYEPCTVAQVAKYVGIQPTYLARLFREEIGISPHDFIRQKKMEEAQRLLQYYDYSIAEIADSLGYCDIAHFSKTFQQYFGLSPKKYRKTCHTASEH